MLVLAGLFLAPPAVAAGGMEFDPDDKADWSYSVADRLRQVSPILVADQ